MGRSEGRGRGKAGRTEPHEVWAERGVSAMLRNPSATVSTDDDSLPHSPRPGARPEPEPEPEPELEPEVVSEVVVAARHAAVAEALREEAARAQRQGDADAAAEAAAAAKIQGVCRGRIARRALSPRLAAAKQEQQQEPEPEPEPELVDVPVEEVCTAAC